LQPLLFMAVTGWVIFGFMVGLLANAAWPTWSGRGLILMACAGIGGALLFGWAGAEPGIRLGLDPQGLVAAAVGSILFVAVAVALRLRRRRSQPPAARTLRAA
jgi:uncharacterized membrane protein YeaQ/YmgE (transglycosylase-associated protein family)